MNNFFKKTFPILLFALCIPAFSSASSIKIETEDKTFVQGKDILVQVSLDTEGMSINAVEGKLVFPKDLIEPLEIQDGNSAINFWIERPRIGDAGEIAFSGISAGGITKSNALLFKVVFRTKATGNGRLEANSIRLLQNDGNGTEAKTNVIPLSFSISQATSTIPSSVFSVEDDTPPEDFMPMVSSSTDIFNGKYFLVFVAEDKGSGIDYYEVREGMFGKYRRATSPFELYNQSLDRSIYIKAVDKRGNEKVVRIDAERSLPLYQEAIILGIIIALVAFVLRKKIWPKSKR